MALMLLKYFGMIFYDIRSNPPKIETAEMAYK
jgi:hypothetical protein